MIILVKTAKTGDGVNKQRQCALNQWQLTIRWRSLSSTGGEQQHSVYKSLCSLNPTARLRFIHLLQYSFKPKLALSPQDKIQFRWLCLFCMKFQRANSTIPWSCTPRVGRTKSKGQAGKLWQEERLAPETNSPDAPRSLLASILWGFEIYKYKEETTHSARYKQPDSRALPKKSNFARGGRYPIGINSMFDFCQIMIHSIIDSILL